MDLSLITTSSIMVFALIAVRLTGLIISAPFFTQTAVPVQVQALLSICISFIAFPLFAGAAQVSFHTVPQFLFAAVQEFIIGAVLGFTTHLFIIAAEMGGQMVATQIGLSMASAMDPVTQQQNPVIGQLYTFLAMMIFLNLNIHHHLIATLFYTFKLFPVGAAGGFQLSHVAEHFMALGQMIFTLSCSIVLPIMGMSLAEEISLAFVSKLMPQMNVFMVALPLKIGIGLVLVIATLPFSQDVIKGGYAQLLKEMVLIFKQA
jgi:flagellar biosynthesis protein FliR